MVEDNSSSERLPTERETDRRFPSLSNRIQIHHIRDSRRRRELIRNELLRILTSSEFDRRRGDHGTILLRNLQMLQMSSMNRDFNENDYELLSQLDNGHQSRYLTEKNYFMISQLPTYQFKSKQSPSAKKDQDEVDQDVDEEQQQCSHPQILNQDYESKNFCTICIEDFQDEEIIKLLPCFHQFHQSCVDDWLLRKTLCPICKFDVNSNNGQEDLESYQ